MNEKMPIYVSYYAQGSNPRELEPRTLRLEHAKNYENEFFSKMTMILIISNPFLSIKNIHS